MDAVRLTPASQAILEEELRSGAYASAEEIVERALALLHRAGPGPVAEVGNQDVKTMEFAAFARHFARFSHKMPVLPPEVDDRASYYEDHD